MSNLNETHDIKRKSWIESANSSGNEFPIQNLPYGVFSTADKKKRIGVAIGDYILDLKILEKQGLLKVSQKRAFNTKSLNKFMALGPQAWQLARKLISELLEYNNPILKENRKLRSKALVRASDATLHLPFYVRSFTDFYASKEHATNVGSMFRDPENALLPNWLHVPIGYNGRASTVVVSQENIHRPHGQLKLPENDHPIFEPTKKLDFELELGAVVGYGNTMGQPISTAQAYNMIFGYVLLNDWSARDIQTWEYQPLGPFQSKAFATTISPWVVTREALEPFRAKTPERVKPLLGYLHESTPNNFDLQLQVKLKPKGGNHATTICKTNYKNMYYSIAQQLAHHGSSGCAMEVGDLLGSGTISGSAADSFGSLLELTWNGKNPLVLNNGDNRTFIENGDTVIMEGFAEENGIKIGFGQCTGSVLPSLKLQSN